VRGFGVKAPWKNLVGPSRSLAISATVLLVASGLAGIEAAVMLILGPAVESDFSRDILLKPFAILGYLEGCAIVFSSLGIVISIVSLIFQSPYLYIRETIRARRLAHADNNETWDGPVFVAPGHYREEDGSPD
jgi:hypothetical protein